MVTKKISRSAEFPDDVVDDAWKRAAGYDPDGDVIPGRAFCECLRVSHHNHPGTYCGKRLAYVNRGRGSGPGEWEANHRTRVESGGKPTYSNCEIVCVECHLQM